MMMAGICGEVIQSTINKNLFAKVVSFDIINPLLLFHRARMVCRSMASLNNPVTYNHAI
jgi:hypothetical protein